MATSDLNIVVKAKNEASATLKKVQADVSGLDKAAGLMKGGIAGVAAVAGISAVVELGAAVADLANKAGQVQILRRSFDDLAQAAGQSSTTMLDALRGASAGMISDADLMLSANKAMMLGVADTADEMTGLLDVARVRGQAMGLSVTQAFNDIVTGLGRESALILDNLGLAINLDATYSTYAATLGKTVSALSQVERKQALVNEVMRQSAGMSTEPIDNAATSMERMNAAIANAQVALGELFGPAIAQIANNLAEAVNETTDAITTSATEAAQNNMRAWGPQITDMTQRLQDLQALASMADFTGDTKGFAAATQDLQELETRISSLATAYNEAAAVTGAPLLDIAQLKEGVPAFVELTQATDQAATAMQRVPAAASAMASGLSQIQAQAGATAGIIYNLAGAINTLNGISAARPDALDSVLGQINGIAGGLIDNLGIDAALAKGDELKVQTRQRAEDLRAIGYTESDIALILQSELGTTQAWASELDKVATQSVPAISAEFSNLKSTVEGVLSGAFAETAGVDLSGILPRDDAVAENARRLADIAKNGLNNQEWLDDFAATAPGAYADLMLKIAAGADAKTAAAQILSDFNAGLRTDLIDRETAKEQVRKMILGEANMAALAAEIAQELATEMGIPLQEAMAAAGAALGVPTAGAGGATAGAAGATGATPPDMTGTGAAAGTTFVTGFQTTATGTLLVATMVSQMQTAILSFQSPGQNAGKTWGAGFMTTVETSIAQPLISLLVTLVTPGVMAQLATAESQTTPP